MEGEFDECIKGFEDRKRLTSKGVEYWYARELGEMLGYVNWVNFKSVLEKARVACTNSGIAIENHFADTSKMVAIGSGAQRESEDFYLTRYACYLVAMNADSSKPVVGFAMTYFAVKARSQEVQEQRQLTEEERRVDLRLRTIENNKLLNGAAKSAGVTRYGLFHDAGYRGFYNGMSAAEVKQTKGIPPNEELLDRVGPLELAAHDFRITLTQDRLTRQNIRTEAHAISTHKDVGVEVRSVMERKDGVRPESLPISASIKGLVAKRRKQFREPPKDIT